MFLVSAPDKLQVSTVSAKLVAHVIVTENETGTNQDFTFVIYLHAVLYRGIHADAIVYILLISIQLCVQKKAC